MVVQLAGGNAVGKRRLGPISAFPRERWNDGFLPRTLLQFQCARHRTQSCGNLQGLTRSRSLHIKPMLFIRDVEQGAAVFDCLRRAEEESSSWPQREMEDIHCAFL